MIIGYTDEFKDYLINNYLDTRKAYTGLKDYLNNFKVDDIPDQYEDTSIPHYSTLYRHIERNPEIYDKEDIMRDPQENLKYQKKKDDEPDPDPEPEEKEEKEVELKSRIDDVPRNPSKNPVKEKQDNDPPGEQEKESILDNKVMLYGGVGVTAIIIAFVGYKIFKKMKGGRPVDRSPGERSETAEKETGTRGFRTIEDY